ncbi:MAG TPA: FAD/NAD(P)-binding protein [Bacillota bacterium]|nr:FAD/NAD(P)-binding protein [Bacillota bacterium]
MCKCAANNPMYAYPATITKIIEETPDVKTFQLVFDDPQVYENFGNKPGQVCMLSLPGHGEITISITSSPTRKGFLEFSIKKCGRVTDVVHQLEEGAKMGIRGPYGNTFPYDMMKGKDLVIIGGGIGLAPVRSLIDYVLADENRADYGHVDVVYGARSKADLVFKYDLFETWPAKKDTSIHVTIDRPEEGWDGKVAFVPAFLEELNFSPENKVCVLCGPPIMIKFVLQSMSKMGWQDEQIISTLEGRMKCCIGKCGRCNVGSKFICLDGPVFNLAQIKEMPEGF